MLKKIEGAQEDILIKLKADMEDSNKGWSEQLKNPHAMNLIRAICKCICSLYHFATLRWEVQPVETLSRGRMEGKGWFSDAADNHLTLGVW